MPVRPLNLRIMIGDGMNNDNPPNFPRPPEKNISDSSALFRRNTSMNSSSSSIPISDRSRERNFPLPFRQWPEPPPPPPRTRLSDKKINPLLKKRPGSADPRFHRRITNDVKSNLTTQSDGKMVLKNSSLMKETSEPQFTHDPIFGSSRFRQHVDDWLNAQATTPKIPEPEENIKTVSVGNSSTLLNSKACQTERMQSILKLSSKLHELTGLASLSQSEVLESLPSISQHKIVRLPSENNYFNSDDEESITSVSSSMESISKTNTSIPLPSRSGQIEEITPFNTDRDFKYTLCHYRDSQINVVCSHPDNTTVCYKSLTFLDTSSMVNIILWCCAFFATLICVHLSAKLWPNLLDYFEDINYYFSAKKQPGILGSTVDSIIEQTIMFQ